MRGSLFLVGLLILSIGCASLRSPVDGMMLEVGMTIDDFLAVNGLSYDAATEIKDSNGDGNDDLFVWDLDEDGVGEVVIELNEAVREGEHGVTPGFNKIFIYDDEKKILTIADVGKNTGKVRFIKNQPV